MTRAAKANKNKKTLRELAAGIRAAEVDPRELLEEKLERIAKFDGELGAFTFVNAAGARKIAAERWKEAKRGNVGGRLHGLTFSLKDHIDIERLPRSEGSKATYVKKARATAYMVQRLLKEGAICIGKTNMAEKGKSYFTENPLYGRTENPHKHGYSPGGSGGGDAAALAAGFCDFGVGLDAGGSVRVPANFCGVYGLMPTHGLVSDYGLSSFTHTIGALFRGPGIFAGTPDDLEVLLSVMSGFVAEDPLSIPNIHEYSLRRPIRHRRFAFYKSLNGTRCDSRISASIDEAARKLKRAGWEAVESVPPPMEGALPIFIIMAGQAALLLEDTLQGGGNPDLEGPLMQKLRARIARELPPLTAETLLKCWFEVDRLRIAMADWFKQFDFILAPVTATLPPQHDTSEFRVGRQSLKSQEVFQFASCVNVVGCPAMAIPTGVDESNLPIGVQLIARKYDEQMLFEAANALLQDDGSMARQSSGKRWAGKRKTIARKGYSKGNSKGRK